MFPGPGPRLADPGQRGGVAMVVAGYVVMPRRNRGVCVPLCRRIVREVQVALIRASLRGRAVAAGFAVLCVLAAGCSSGTRGAGSPAIAVPGVVHGSIVIGSDQPLTGALAPGYDEIAPAENAYFQYVNAHGGVDGRRIVYRYLNDEGNPAYAASAVRRLVLGDAVFAVFNGAGIVTHLAVAPFLNAARVPDVFAGSGCACWDALSGLPYTYGWGLDSVREGKILGSYIDRQYRNEKVGIFYQDDAFGLGGARGLSDEIPRRRIAAKVSYSAASRQVGPLVARLKASGAQVVVSFSTPGFTALLRLAMNAAHYSPHLLVSSAGSDPATVAGLLDRLAGNKPAGFGAALTQGIITDSYLPSPAQASDSWIALFRRIHDQYLRGMPFDGNVVYGMAAAYTFAEALARAGPDPNRGSLVTAINSGLPPGPAVAPLAYSAADHGGVTGAWIGQIRSGSLTRLTGVMTTSDTAASPVRPYTVTGPGAPGSGIPPR